MSLSDDFSQTTIEAARANTLASSTAMVAHLNDGLKNLYLSRFNDWSINVLSGRIPNTNWPLPENAYRVSAPDANGFQWPEVGEDAVCGVPPIPEDHTAPQVKVPGELDVLNVPAGDPHKPGDIVTGSVLIALGANPAEVGSPFARFLRSATRRPFGVYNFYERL